MSRAGEGQETHRSQHAGWLRAAVLGADDGIVSTASLMVGVAASKATHGSILTAGLAGLVAGSMSMGAGEYVSVSSQRDTERADLAKEVRELEEFPDAELRELTEIYVKRGLDRPLAVEVAKQLSDHDALGSHLRDELGLDLKSMANPVQAAGVSAGAFAAGAAIPLIAAMVGATTWVIAAVALIALAMLGVIGARIGGAAQGRAAVRVLVGGGLAMALTAMIGSLVGGRI